ncbi:hypothetical protein L6452_16595 [Arctium lappa]|uniref:Uncharacterized protein n=1 Tax=Arctium lappa TaxID=4217 RepID=A0ACB9C0X2_ARCLA|nr:hypothetical protein L6452_16595 [Arctium lappa]
MQGLVAGLVKGFEEVLVQGLVGGEMNEVKRVVGERCRRFSSFPSFSSCSFIYLLSFHFICLYITNLKFLP